VSPPRIHRCAQSAGGTNCPRLSKSGQKTSLADSITNCGRFATFCVHFCDSGRFPSEWITSEPGIRELQQSGTRQQNVLISFREAGKLYCFFVISHDRRRILHCNVTRHPTSLWIVQQLREAFPFDSAPRFLIFDQDAKYGWEVPSAVRSLKMSPIRTSFQSPWQNGIAERWVAAAATISWITSLPSMNST